MVHRLLIRPDSTNAYSARRICRVAALLGWTLSVLWWSACAGTEDSGDASEHSPVVSFETASGLKVELLRQTGSGLIAANVFVGAGSTREEDASAGSSHFLEHLLFNGTTSRTQEELYAEVDRIGAYNNATTRQEYTHFMMVAPRERMRSALEIQADMLLHSTLPPEKFEKERGIVVEELRKDQDSLDYRRQRTFAEAEFDAGNPYRRAVLGSAKTIENLQRDTVWDYYRSQYVPSNMRLLLMGDFDEAEARDLVESLFPPADGSAQPSCRPAPAQAPLHAHLQRLRHFEDEAMSFTLSLPAPAADSPDLAAFEILAQVLGEGESSRISAAFDAAGITPHRFGTGILHQEGHSRLELSGRFDPGTDPHNVARLVLGELATVAAYGIRAAEWAPARTTLLSASIRHLSQLHYYALFEGDRIWHAGAAAEAHLQRGLEASYDRLDTVAERWLEHPALEITCLGPGLEDRDAEFVPEEAGWQARAPEGDTAPLPGGGQLVDNRPLAASAQAATVTVLDNGLTVIHRADPQTRMFGIHVWVRDRSAREPVDREGIADLLHRCLPLGAGAYDRTELDAALRGIGAELKVCDSAFIPYDDYYTSPRFSFVRLDCVDRYWSEALRLLGIMLQEPTLEPAAIEEKIQEIARRRAQDAGSSRSVAAHRLNRELLGDHPLARSVYGSEGSLDGVTSEQLRGFALDYLDPGQLILSIVCNLDRDAVLTAVESNFARSASDGRGARAPEPWPLTRESKVVELEVGGRQSTVQVARIFEIDPADQWALEAAVRMLSLRMQQEIREVRGLAYSLGMWVQCEGTRARLEARVGTQPENLEEVRTLVSGFFRSPATAFTTEELEVAVNGSVGRTRMRQVTALGQAYVLSRDYVIDGDLEATAHAAESLTQLDVAEVSRVCEKYLGRDPEPPAVWVVAR